jgi:hypothetical protein
MGLRTSKQETLDETKPKRHYMHRVFYGLIKDDLEYLGAEELRKKYMSSLDFQSSTSRCSSHRLSFAPLASSQTLPL